MIRLKSILTEQPQIGGMQNPFKKKSGTDSYEIGGLSVSEMMSTSTTSEGYRRFVFKAKHTNTDYATTDPEATCKLLVQQKDETPAGPMYTIISLACTSGKDFGPGSFEPGAEIGKGEVVPELEQTIEDVITDLGTNELFTIKKN